MNPRQETAERVSQRALRVDELSAYDRWDCIHFATLSDHTRAELHGAGFECRNLAGRDIRSERDLFASVAAVLEFPDYFGMNWDALDECLSDLSWLPTRGYVLVVQDSRLLWRQALTVVGLFTTLWLSCSQMWSREKTPSHLLFADTSSSPEAAC